MIHHACVLNVTSLFAKALRPLAAAALLGILIPQPMQAQEQLSEEDKARLAASDGAGAMPSTMLSLPFHDPFDGNQLAADWATLNVNPDKFVVENGGIFVIETGGKARPDNPETDNVFVLGHALPAGDFDMTLKGTLDPKTGYENIWLGLRAGAEDYLAANLSILTKGCGAALYLNIENTRVLDKGEKPVKTWFGDNLFDGPLLKDICTSGRTHADAALAVLPDSGFTLTFSRRGMRYFTSVELDLPSDEKHEGGRKTVASFALSRVEPFGQPFFMLGQSSQARNGESSATFDDFSIIAVQ